MSKNPLATKIFGSIKSIFLTLILFIIPVEASSQTSYCGDVPPVSDDVLKGVINGRAQFLSRFLGDAALAGEITTSRTEIFSKYKNADERSNAYFEYQVC